MSQQKVHAYIQQSVWEKINTQEQIQQKFPIRVLSPQVCPLCLKGPESVAHLLNHCNFAAVVESVVFACEHWVFPFWLICSLRQWRCTAQNKKARKLRQRLFMILLGASGSSVIEKFSTIKRKRWGSLGLNQGILSFWAKQCKQFQDSSFSYVVFTFWVVVYILGLSSSLEKRTCIQCIFTLIQRALTIIYFGNALNRDFFLSIHTYIYIYTHCPSCVLSYLNFLFLVMSNRASQSPRMQELLSNNYNQINHCSLLFWYCIATSATNQRVDTGNAYWK